jgi:hypothetical protein
VPPGIPGFPAAAAAPVAPAPVRTAAAVVAPSSNWLSATTGQTAVADAPAAAAINAAPPAPPVRVEARKVAKAAVNPQVPPPVAPAPPPRTAVGPPGVLLAGDAGSQVSERSSEGDSGVDQLTGATKGLNLNDSRGPAGVGPAPSPEVLNLTSMPATFTLQAARQILDATHQ